MRSRDPFGRCPIALQRACRRAAANGLALAAALAFASIAPLSIAQDGGGGGVVEVCVPVPGTQTNTSRATAFFDVFTDVVVTLQGDVTVQSGPPGANGVIPIELTAMRLTGSTPMGPATLRLNPQRRSVGEGRNPRLVEDGATRTPYCAIDSFFDVFVEIDIAGPQGPVVVHNDLAIRMVSPKPVPARHDRPFELVQENQGVPLLDQAGRIFGRISNTRHEVGPPPPPPCFPPKGTDVMRSNLFHDIDIPGIGLCQANLSGPVTVERSDPYVDLATGLACIDTKIVDLNLQGVDPVCGRICITLSPFQSSTGKICEKVRGTCFPANSYFDVFIKVELKDLGICLYSCVPARMECMIDAIPPFGCGYNLNVGGAGPVPLYRAPCDPPAGFNLCAVQPLPAPAAFIVKAVHQPEPPDLCKCFPPAGEDVMVTTLIHNIVFPGFNLNCSTFTGPMVVRRSDPFIDANGLCCVKTEIVRMEMRGTCNDGTPAIIRLCPDRRSTGLICAKERGTCFPAQSCFDIFFEVEVRMPTGLMKFKNCKPAVMCCMIDRLPPIGCSYAIQNAPIELYKVPATGGSPCNIAPLPVPDGIVQNATHRPDEPADPCCPEYGPGKDVFDSTLLHDIEIPGIGTCQGNLRGPVVVERGVPYIDPLTGLCCVETRMVSMQLQGSDPLCGRILITLDPRRPSKGRICQMPGMTSCFPAQSCFDIFVRIELPDLGLTLFACEPANMCCKIDRIPPFGCLYNLDIGTTNRVPLFQEDPAAPDPCTSPVRPVPRAFIVKAVHTPDPPCTCFPPEGEDVMRSELSHRVRLFGLGPNGGDLLCEADMVGPVTVRRSAPYRDPLTGLCCIDTEMTSMELRGNDPVCGPVILRLCPDRASKGKICQKPDNPPDRCFPANSLFDIFIEIEIPSLGVKLKNCAPARMECMIDSIPPINCVYELNLTGVPLFKPDECPRLPNADIRPTGIIEIAQHVPRMPCECPYGPGRDVMDSTLTHNIVLFGLQEKLCSAPLTGVVEIERLLPYKDNEGRCCVTTRMVRLDLSGDDPVCGPIKVRLCPEKPSRGIICQRVPGGPCFPAQSCFEVFVEIEVMGMVFKNCSPATLCCVIDAIPPFGCNFRLEAGERVLLFKKGDCDVPGATPLGEITEAVNTPQPCGPVPGSLVCKTSGTSVDLQWRTVCPCDKVEVVRDGAVIATLPGTATSFLDTVECEPGATKTYTYCVRCVAGSAASRQVCCEVVIDCPNVPDCIEGVRCEPKPGGDGAVISWTYIGDCRCDRVIVSRDGSPIATLPGTQTSLELPDCTPGRYCVQCVRVGDDGAAIVGPRHCCTLECPPTECRDCIESVACTREGPFVILSWVTSPEPTCACDTIEIWHRSPLGALIKIGEVSGTTAFQAPCRPGEYCIRCKCADGNVGTFHCCQPVTKCRPRFRRGDADGDGEINITDGVRILNVLFLGQGEITCPDAADTNDQGELNITSGVFVLNWLFLGGREPPAPGPTVCGEDDTDDAMEECLYEACLDES